MKGCAGHGSAQPPFFDDRRNNPQATGGISLKRETQRRGDPREAFVQERLLWLDRRRCGLCGRGVRLGRRLLWAARLPRCGAEGTWLVLAARLRGRHRAFPHRRARGRQSAGAACALRPRRGDQGRCAVARARRPRLGARGRAMAALRGDHPERRGLGGAGRCRHQRHRVPLVRARPSGGAGDGL